MGEVVVVAVTYRREWPDGFGARGWKLDVAIGDPEVIAATAEAGLRIPTSVLIHDILDHHLCQLPLSGHRNEALALQQLADRTGSDSMPDLLQMVDEDIQHGRVIGESMRDFLPEDLLELVPSALTDDREIVRHLRGTIGQANLRHALAHRLRQLGLNAADEMRLRYEQNGLDHARRCDLGLALQSLLNSADALAVSEDWTKGHGNFLLSNDLCTLRIGAPRAVFFESGYH